MKVIFIKDIPRVARKNEVKEVADGYARNFLFARGFAKPADDASLKSLAAETYALEKEIAAEHKKYQALAEKLRSAPLYFKTKMGEKGKAFGSITTAKIHDALAKQGIAIEKDWIELDESIKTLGEHTVAIRFPSEITGNLKIIVEAE